ncbi:hypothetical protein AX16_005770 [Volvariella volvacea WC 439]|nr:hypothetical protein AX16_005770 [Volvariella volvacea WC 439]
MALPTKGRVIIDTSAGEIDIELWSKVCDPFAPSNEPVVLPKPIPTGSAQNMSKLPSFGYGGFATARREFVTRHRWFWVWFRVVPGFLVQTGDKTGTGAGGESFYGEPFEDEIHPRLRFAHRGLVGMANNGTKDSNDSQFFITLDRADELNGKHTLFGRVRGDTVYNALKIGEAELGENERPIYPPKIKTIRIIDNPFDDIIPRITAAERRAQQKAREEAQREREEEERRRTAKKNVKLLSFGDDAGEEETETVSFKKKPIFRPDLAEVALSERAIPDFVTQPKVSTKSSDEGSSKTQKQQEPDSDSEKRAKNSKKEDDITRIREKHQKEKAAGENARKAEIEKMEAEVRKLARRTGGADSDSEDERAKKKAKKSYLEEELMKYAKNRGVQKKGKRKDETDVLAALNSFRGKLQQSAGMSRDEEDMDVDKDEGKAEGAPSTGAGEEGIEVDDDTGFMNHALHFPKDNTEETVKAERDYEVIDPRQRGARAKEEERERRRAAKKSSGGGGGRYRR